MADVKGAGLVPVTIYWRDSRIPDLVLHDGETGTRGYRARFLSAEGELIKPKEGMTATCYARNRDTGQAYYLEGIAGEDYWDLEVPGQAVSHGGVTEIQIALKEGGKALIMTDWSTVKAQGFIGADPSRPVGVTDSGVLMDYQTLHEQAERAESIMDDVEEAAEEAKKAADQAKKDLQTIQAGEAGRTSAENARVEAEKKRETQEGTRKSQETARVNAEKKRAEAETARASAETKRAEAEQARVTAEGKRAEAEKKRETSEKTRETKETERQTAETKRSDQEAQRQANEKVRQANEETRKSQEGTRQTQEAERVEAEKRRKGLFETWEGTMEGVIPVADGENLGIVDVEGTEGESKPFTVPSVGKLNGELLKKADESHTHTTSDITGLDQLLEEVVDSFETLSEQMSVSMTEELEEMAPKGHTHTTSDITGLDKALEEAGKVKSVNGKTGDVTVKEYDDTALKGRVAALEGKEDKDTTYSPATPSAQGLMSASDKKKLDGIESGAQKNPDMALYATKEDLDAKFILCTSLDDAKEKAENGSYPTGTIFLIKKA